MLLTIALCVVACKGSSPAPSPAPSPSSPPCAAGPVAEGPVGASCLDALPRVLTASGAIDPPTYQHLAQSLGRADGIAFRFGPDATCVQNGPPRAPTAWAAPHRFCPTENPGWGEGYTYEVGGACNDDAAYGSTQGPVVFDADAPEGSGVDWLQYMAYGYNVMAYRPVPSWTWGGAARAPFFTDAKALAAHGGPFSQPVAVGRSPGNQQSENDQGAVIAFADGALQCLGTNTGRCDFSGQLPPDTVPIAVAATSDSEFVLVLLWEPPTKTSSLAVFAMTSNYALNNPGGGVFPGLQQGGDFHTGKLLGLVALPDLHVPTSLAANSTRGGTGASWFDTAGAQMPANRLMLSDEPTRQTLMPGGKNYQRYGLSGFAMVGSKYERKVTLVDLQPLFDFYNAKYFGTRADFDLTQSKAGAAPDQWPFTFETAPQSKPVVVTTVATDDLVTAVYAGWVDPTRQGVKPLEAAVATMNGKLHRYAVGGLIDPTPAVADVVKEIDAIDVGRNVTSIVQSKHGNYEEALTDIVMASRGDREIEFVSYADGSGKVLQRISDGRMNDPISVYDSTRAKFVITVADYTGRRVLSYRYGAFTYKGYKVQSPPIGPGPDGTSQFDFGGSWSTAGRPFGVTATNVN
ncbi:MAG: hypothetical protein JWO86_8530 [Myxococcaceae bacterium]|nr:hypothetical protein [Myxococcaceae bacterium]